MTKRYTPVIILLLATCALSACGNEASSGNLPPAAPTTASIISFTPTPDPCAPENIPAEIEMVHSLMREFDDASLLASNTPLDQLNPTIAELQRIRREAEDQVIPDCLTTLKQHQLTHMNTVINTMLGFLSGANANVLNESIALARQQHDQYTLELATLLGVTVVSPPTAEAPEETPQADTTPATTLLTIINPGPTAVNMRTQPDLGAETLGILDIGASAVVLGRTVDAFWYQIELPGQPSQTAWVYVSLVQISDPTVDIPVINPAP